jgi:FAD binding domain
LAGGQLTWQRRCTNIVVAQPLPGVYPGLATIENLRDAVAATRIAHVQLPDEMRSPNGGLDIPGVGTLPWGHNRLENGGFIHAEFERDRAMVGTIEFDDVVSDESEPMTIGELRDSARRVLGTDLPVEPPTGHGPHALRRIAGQNTRQADRYRAGNVFLLGDSAHVHSAMGGPGLNLGLQDAMNLGWRTRDRRAARAFKKLLKQPGTAEHIAHLLAGSDVRYDIGDGHPLPGRLVPDLTLDGGQRVAELLHEARPVLLDLSGGAVADAARGWSRQVNARRALAHVEQRRDGGRSSARARPRTP